MNKSMTLQKIVLERAMQTMGFNHESEAGNYMYGFFSGLLNHLERSVPGVAEELANEITRQERKNH